MTFGHLALASIAHDTLFKKTGLLLLSLAAFGPDLIDKPLSLLFGCHGRGVGHTLLTFLIVLATGWLLCRSGKISRTVFLACALLWLSHLGADFLDSRTAFWPMLGPFPEKLSLTFWEKIDHWLHFYQHWQWSDLQSCLEIGSILTALFLRNRRHPQWNPAVLWRRTTQSTRL